MIGEPAHLSPHREDTYISPEQNIMKVQREAWTPEEDAVLRKEALAGRSIAEIAAEVGRTEAAVRTLEYILRVLLRRPKK